MKSIFLKLSIFLFIALQAVNTKGQITAHELASQMGRGINLGNTLDGLPTEGSWYPKKAEEYYFDAIKQAGFKNIRIPVTWQEHFNAGTDYTINEVWLDRVEEVVDWALEAGLIVTLNAHHDGWIKNKYTPENIAKFDSLWSQIATRFKGKSDSLVFEMLNEPEVMTIAQLNQTNARILKIIRKTNPTRIVLFSGTSYNASDNLIAIAVPDPNDKYLMGFFHAYDPWSFVSGTSSWYGTEAEIKSLKSNMAKVKKWSIEKNIPVILNEWGATHNSDYNQKMRYLGIYNNIILENFPYSYWDNGGDFRLYEREENKWDDVKDVLMYFTNHSPMNLKIESKNDSTILSWINRINTDSVGIDSTVIQRKSEKQAPFVNYDVVYGNDSTYVDTNNIEPGTLIYYRVINFLGDGSTQMSYPQNVYIMCNQRSSYYSSSFEIPGVIEAEDFDIGCNGLTYFDNSNTNVPGKYRPTEAVDIEARNDGGFQIAYTQLDEWLEYSINVPKQGDYTIISEVATQNSGCIISFSFNSEPKVLSNIPNTGNWQKNAKIYSFVTLNAGEQIMRVGIESQNPFNIDKYTFVEGTISSMNESQNIDAQLYPNPVSGEVNLIINESLFEGSMQMIDIYGKVLIDQPVNGNHSVINTSNVNSGMYVIKVFKNGIMVYRSKLMVNHN